ncbi:MAG: tripartite tricarboxylate transporter TctB family protein [Pseudomonadota bacterium]
MANQTDLFAKTRSAGLIVFVAVSLGLVLLLITQIGSQTIWSEDARNFAGQPRLWPAIGLAVMAFGFGLHLLRMRHRRPNRLDWMEARRWLEPAEYAGWFMIYVFTVPIIGFLPMSITFACALVWRLGYRGKPPFILAAIFAVATAILFKTLLSVNIPGGQIYRFLPGELRSFFLTYL